MESIYIHHACTMCCCCCTSAMIILKSDLHYYCAIYWMILGTLTQALNHSHRKFIGFFLCTIYDFVVSWYVSTSFSMASSIITIWRVQSETTKMPWKTLRKIIAMLVESTLKHFKFILRLRRYHMQYIQFQRKVLITISIFFYWFFLFTLQKLITFDETVEIFEVPLQILTEIEEKLVKKTQITFCTQFICTKFILEQA